MSRILQNTLGIHTLQDVRHAPSGARSLTEAGFLALKQGIASGKLFCLEASSDLSWLRQGYVSGSALWLYRGYICRHYIMPRESFPGMILQIQVGEGRTGTGEVIPAPPELPSPWGILIEVWEKSSDAETIIQEELPPVVADHIIVLPRSADGFAFRRAA